MARLPRGRAQLKPAGRRLPRINRHRPRLRTDGAPNDRADGLKGHIGRRRTVRQAMPYVRLWGADGRAARRPVNTRGLHTVAGGSPAMGWRENVNDSYRRARANSLADASFSRLPVLRAPQIALKPALTIDGSGMAVSCEGAESNGTAYAGSDPLAMMIGCRASLRLVHEMRVVVPPRRNIERDPAGCRIPDGGVNSMSRRPVYQPPAMRRAAPHAGPLQLQAKGPAPPRYPPPPPPGPLSAPNATVSSACCKSVWAGSGSAGARWAAGLGQRGQSLCATDLIGRAGGAGDAGRAIVGWAGDLRPEITRGLGVPRLRASQSFIARAMAKGKAKPKAGAASRSPGTGAAGPRSRAHGDNGDGRVLDDGRSEEHTSELQSR